MTCPDKEVRIQESGNSLANMTEPFHPRNGKKLDVVLGSKVLKHMGLKPKEIG